MKHVEFPIQPGLLFTRSMAEALTVFLISALLCFMPFAYGTVEAWSEFVVLSGAALLCLLQLWRCFFEPDYKVARTWFLLPVGLFAIFTLLQVIPLSRGLLEVVSPETINRRSTLLADLNEPLAETTISFYPLATERGFRGLVVGLTIFVTICSTFTTSRQIKFLLAMILIIGSVQALLAILQVALNAPGVYWSESLGPGATFTGSFLNHSNFCQYMNLSIGCGLALLFMQFEENRRLQAQKGLRQAQSLKLLWTQHGWVLISLILCMISVMVSLSRNGVLSLVIASTVVAVCLGRCRSLDWRGWLLGSIPVVVMLSLSVFGLDAVYSRLARLRDVEYLRNRWTLSLDVLKVWQDFPIVGAGLNAHEVIFPSYDTLEISSLAEQADNDYAQLMEESGLVGSLLIGTALLMVSGGAWRLMRRGTSAESMAVYGLTLGLLAVAIHSTTDFGQRLPAVFCLSAASCAILFRLAANESLIMTKRSHTPVLITTGSALIRYGTSLSLGVLLMGVSVWALHGAYSAFLAERWWADALHFEQHLEAAQWQADDEDFIDLIGSAEAAHELQPQNPLYAYWLNVYRWQFFSRRFELSVPLKESTKEAVTALADQLAALRSTCPTYGAAFGFEGQLRKFVLGDDRGISLIRWGARLSPYDALSSMVAGELEVQLGRPDEAWPFLRRAVTLQPTYFSEAAAVCLALGRIDWAELLTDTNHRRLATLAKLCANDDQFRDDATRITQQAELALEQSVTSWTASPQEIAQLANSRLKSGDSHSAVDFFRRALITEYNRVDWRLGLARALAKEGEHDNAIHEVKVCLRLSPKSESANRLLAELMTQ